MVRQCEEVKKLKTKKPKHKYTKRTEEEDWGTLQKHTGRQKRNRNEWQMETKRWGKKIDVRRTLILSLYLVLFTSPSFWVGTGALEPGQLGWNLGRGARNSKAGGTAPEDEGGPSSALEGKCVKSKMVLRDLLPLSFFLPSPCLTSQISYESKASFMLCRKKEEVRKGRQKIFRVVVVDWPWLYTRCPSRLLSHFPSEAGQGRGNIETCEGP